MMLGSMVSLGLGLFTTAIGGVNCRSETFGSRPLLAGNGRTVATAAAAAHGLLLRRHLRYEGIRRPPA